MFNKAANRNHCVVIHTVGCAMHISGSWFGRCDCGCTKRLANICKHEEEEVSGAWYPIVWLVSFKSRFNRPWMITETGHPQFLVRYTVGAHIVRILMHTWLGLRNYNPCWPAWIFLRRKTLFCEWNPRIIMYYGSWMATLRILSNPKRTILIPVSLFIHFCFNLVGGNWSYSCCTVLYEFAGILITAHGIDGVVIGLQQGAAWYSVSGWGAEVSSPIQCRPQRTWYPGSTPGVYFLCSLMLLFMDPNGAWRFTPPLAAVLGLNRKSFVSTPCVSFTCGSQVDFDMRVWWTQFQNQLSS